MYFTIFILLLFGCTFTTSATPTATIPTNETHVTVPISFFPDVVAQHINKTSTVTNSTLAIRNKNGIACCGESLQGWQGADIGYTTGNIGYLKTRGACWVGAGSCVRIACQWKSAIWLCNIRNEIIAPACPYLASYAEDIMGTCSSRGFYAACGIETDSENYSVLVMEGSC